MKLSDFKHGMKVTYTPKNEKGVVMSVGKKFVNVVYNPDGNWDYFFNYTPAPTLPKDLKIGWK